MVCPVRLLLVVGSYPSLLVRVPFGGAALSRKMPAAPVPDSALAPPGPAVCFAFDAAAHASCLSLLHMALYSTRPAFGSPARPLLPQAGARAQATAALCPLQVRCSQYSTSTPLGRKYMDSEKPTHTTVESLDWLAAVVRMLTIAGTGRHRPQPERAGAPSDPGCPHPRLPPARYQARGPTTATVCRSMGMGGWIVKSLTRQL